MTLNFEQQVLFWSQLRKCKCSWQISNGAILSRLRAFCDISIGDKLTYFWSSFVLYNEQIFRIE